MTTLSQNQKNQKGFSLLELLLVVAVGAVLILAGLAAYRLVSENNSVNDATRLLNIIKQQTQRAFQSESTYGAAGDDLVPTLVALRAFPAGVLDGANVPRHPFNSDIITVVANDQEFTIEFQNVTANACINLGQLFHNDNDSDFVAFSPDGGTTTDPNPTVAGLTGACADGADIQWTFY